MSDTKISEAIERAKALFVDRPAFARKANPLATATLDNGRWRRAQAPQSQCRQPFLESRSTNWKLPFTASPMRAVY